MFNGDRFPVQEDENVLKMGSGGWFRASLMISFTEWVTIYIWWFFETNSDTAMMLLLPYESKQFQVSPNSKEEGRDSLLYEKQEKKILYHCYSSTATLPN